MGFKLILAGLVFFFNPCINLVDIFPDFIGCILISAGLYKLADMEKSFTYVTDGNLPAQLLELYRENEITIYTGDKEK